RRRAVPVAHVTRLLDVVVAVARVRVVLPDDPVTVQALQRLRAEPVRLATRVRRAARSAAERLHRRLRVRDPVRRVALAADLVAVLERRHRRADRRRRLQRRVPVAHVRQLVPDELELKVQRVDRGPVRRRVPLHVVVVARVPPATRRPLRDAAAGAASVLPDGGAHPRLLVEVAHDPRRLHVRQALAHEELERDLVVRILGDGLLVLGVDGLVVGGADAAGGEEREREDGAEEVRRGAKAEGGGHARRLSEGCATRRSAYFTGFAGGPRGAGGGG